jgi:hypothetical protein
MIFSYTQINQLADRCGRLAKGAKFQGRINYWNFCTVSQSVS